MIAVVGGGITGLALGLELDDRGADFVVLEASGRAGGVIRSAEVHGRVLEWGPQRTRLTPAIAGLIERLGLTKEVITAPPDLSLYVYRGGRLRTVPFSLRDFLTSDIVGLPSKGRLLIEPLTRGADPEERVDRYFRRKLGSELYEGLVGPLYGGLYGSDPADMVVGLSLAHVLRDLGVGRSLVARMLRGGGRIRPPAACSFREGMKELPVAIAGVLGERLRLRSPVHVVCERGAGWRVDCADESYDVESVVICAPAASAASLVQSVAPAASAALRGLRYNPLAVVHLDAKTDLRGLGYQVAFTEARLLTRGVTFNDSLFGRGDLYTAHLGGAWHPEVVAMSEDELGEVAEREFASCTGYDASALSVELEHMPAWDVSWRSLRGLRLPRGLHLAGNWWSRPGLPGRLAEAASVAGLLTAGRPPRWSPASLPPGSPRPSTRRPQGGPGR